jgi:hypothetical protein
MVDNASTDETGRMLDRLDGACIVRNSENVHFLRAVNQGAAEARGSALLLNNDANLMPGAPRAALESLHSAADIGAVGGKLILPDLGCRRPGASSGTTALVRDMAAGEIPMHLNTSSGGRWIIARPLFCWFGVICLRGFAASILSSHLPTMRKPTSVCASARQATGSVALQSEERRAKVVWTTSRTSV